MAAPRTTAPTERCVPVTVHPAGLVLLLEPGETVLEAAARAGVRWPSTCGGQAECGTCVTRVVAGDPLPASHGAEARTLSRFPPRQDHVMRLACQWRPSGPVTLFKPGARPTAT